MSRRITVSIAAIFAVFGLAYFIFGLVLSDSALDVNLRDTYFVISFFHIAGIAGVLCLLVAALVALPAKYLTRR